MVHSRGSAAARGPRPVTELPDKDPVAGLVVLGHGLIACELERGPQSSSSPASEMASVRKRRSRCKRRGSRSRSEVTCMAITTNPSSWLRPKAKRHGRQQIHTTQKSIKVHCVCFTIEVRLPGEMSLVRALLCTLTTSLVKPYSLQSSTAQHL